MKRAGTKHSKGDGVVDGMARRRCAIYTRKSTEDGLEQVFNTLDAQREACEAYILSQAGEGWECLPERYDDGGWSGGNMDRPALKALLADIVRGRVDIVVVYKVDRLTRSLMDFARIVETFDANNASFVSVTQAFNTTNSMGRLTLNVLLSFAQFEREVTGERIRDKIAASRAKGMWMGGNIPIGYDLGDRRLEVNAQEAETVRHIFTRYLTLKSLPALAQELAGAGIYSKRWTSSRGLDRGGVPLSAGAIAHILNNRVYRGDAVHKGKAHPGEHDAIVTDALFDAVQAQLAQNFVGRTARKARAGTSPLAGKIHDADGQPMRVSFSYGRGKRMYRYYISDGLLPRTVTTISNRSGQRLSAARVEKALRAGLVPIVAAPNSVDVFDDVSRVTAFADRLDVTIDIADDDGARAGVTAAILLERAKSVDEAARLDGGALHLSVPLPPDRRGRTTASPDAKMLDGETQQQLAALLRTAHARAAEANASPLHPSDHINMTAPASLWIRQRITLAFLAPDIQKSLLTGTAPPHITPEWMLAQDWPVDWDVQRRLMGM